MNPFSERYKSYSNLDLLRVIEKQSDYQVEAVEAAKHEISKRNLSEHEHSEMRNVLKLENQKKINQSNIISEIENKAKSIFISVVNNINPIQKSASTTERLVRTITIIFALISTYLIYSQYALIKFILLDESIRFDLELILICLPFIWLPIATILFWFRKTAGWILLTIYMIFAFAYAVKLLTLVWNTVPFTFTFLDELFPQISLFSQSMLILFYGVTLWTLTRENLREHFKVNKNLLILTLLVSASLILISLFQILG